MLVELFLFSFVCHLLIWCSILSLRLFAHC